MRVGGDEGPAPALAAELVDREAEHLGGLVEDELGGDGAGLGDGEQVGEDASVGGDRPADPSESDRLHVVRIVDVQLEHDDLFNIDVARLPAQVSDKFPRRLFIGFAFTISAVLWRSSHRRTAGSPSSPGRPAKRWSMHTALNRC